MVETSTPVPQIEPASDVPATVDVSAVIVNWNTRDLLEECLASLRDHAPEGRSLEVIVVDNGSTDGSIEAVRADWPDVVHVVNEKNEGFQRATNRGVELSRGGYLLLINADAAVTPGAVDTMVARLDADERAAVVAPRLVYADGSFQRWTAGRAPDLVSVLTYFLYLERLSAGAAANSLFLTSDVDEPFCPDWVSSACMLVRRDALDETGLLDERYLCYMDDVDICQRFRDAGWTVWYDPTTTVVHHMGQSTERQTGSVSVAAVQNFNDYLTRRNGLAVGLAARAVQCTGYLMRALAHATRSSLSPTRQRDRVWHGHLKRARASFRPGHV
jgi:GT2 family glycosyltransferase